MTTQESIELLRQGVPAWNKWRQEHPRAHPQFILADLSDDIEEGLSLHGADLHFVHFDMALLQGIDLSRADLRGSHLKWTNLLTANLSGANLQGAVLSGADLALVNLSSADLSRAEVNGTDLTDTDLTNTNLTDADLTHALLHRTNLLHADLSRTKVGWTVFADVDLSRVKGLETVKHLGPSTLGMDTLYRSKGQIPDVFLRSAGIAEEVLRTVRLLTDQPEHTTCFLSHSWKDDIFVKRLHADLQRNGVRCWFLPYDGSYLVSRSGFGKLVRDYDKIIHILSEHSLASTWFQVEIPAALDKEKTEEQQVLFPVCVDTAYMESPHQWTTDLRQSHHIYDFTQWKHDEEYRKGLDRLLDDVLRSRSWTQNSDR
jgi:uncharacterized protein YjbI with pentapeptide repeats